jgi:TonB-dependent starch-binding outer membrane protein SusC
MHLNVSPASAVAETGGPWCLLKTPWINQLLRIMRITAVILLSICLQVSARTHSQTVSLSGRGISLEKIFEEIRIQTQLNVFYHYDLIRNSAPVDIDANSVPIVEFLERVLKHQQLTFTIQQSTIFIERVDHPSPKPMLETTPPFTVRGKIINENGEPVVASIIIKGTNKGVTSNSDGSFEIAGVENDAVLIISAANIETREINLNGSNDIGVISVRKKVSPLDEMQVIAYGSQSKRLLTGNVTTITAKEMGNQLISNPLLALQGRVAGVNISQNTGVPGGGININIRGQNSLRIEANEPFYIIDGVPYSASLLPNLGAGILSSTNGNAIAGAGNPLNFISPNNIESISVLKDADATAIHGSRGANGVILITTKKGKAGKNTVDINLTSGIGTVPKKLNILNTQQYLRVRHEAFQNDAITPDEFNAPDLFVWDTSRYTDWQKRLVGDNANFNNAQASLSGGSSSVQYLLQGTFGKSTTVFPGNFADNKISLHSSISTISNNQRFKSSFSGTFLSDLSNLPNTDLMQVALTLPPNAPPVYDENGNLNWENSTWQNPFVYTKMMYKSNTTNLTSNLNVQYDLLKGLTLSSSFGYTQLQVDEISTSPISSLDPSSTLKTGSASFTNNAIRTWIIEPQLRYNVNIGKTGKVDALIGTTFQKNVGTGEIINGSGYTSDDLLQNPQAAAVIKFTSVTNNVYNYNALFGRLTYNLLSRYIINITARKDGSSRFGTNNRFHNFGSLGAAWIFSEEKSIKQNLSFLSYGKLRGSFGSTGNDQIGDYSFYDLFKTTQNPYQGAPGLIPQGLYNPALQWEETKKLEIGLDIGLLANRMLFNISYYRTRSDNQLVQYSLPWITGFSSVSLNFPALIENRGVEISLNTNFIKNNYVSWDAGFNFTFPRNKLVSFPGIEKTFYNSFLKVGEPVTVNKVFNSLGINDTTGLYQFIDSKGLRTYDPSFATDMTSFINPTAQYYGGLSNSLRYKGFQLDLLFQFTKQLGRNYRFSL